MAAIDTLALSAESFVGRAEMVTGSYETSPGAYVETLHGARTVPTAERARATNPRRGKGVKLIMGLMNVLKNVVLLTC